MHDLAIGEACSKLLKWLENGGDTFKNGCIRQDGHVVFSEIDAGFKHGDQLDEFLLDRLQTTGESALELLGRDLSLVECLRVDEVADGFGLGEIDAAVEKGAHGELARLGGARSGGDAQLDDVPKHDRRAMGRDLDDVVGGVGTGPGEVGDDDFVDASRASGFRLPISSICVDGNRFDEFTEDGSSWLQIMVEPQHWTGDFACPRPGDAHHSNAATPRRCGDSNDRIVKVHRAIVAGDATTFSISAFS